MEDSNSLDIAQQAIQPHAEDSTTYVARGAISQCAPAAMAFGGFFAGSLVKNGYYPIMGHFDRFGRLVRLSIDL